MELNWSDPSLREDRLPQPYRFINKLLERLLEDALDAMTNQSPNRASLESRYESRSHVFSPDILSDVDIGDVTCTTITPDGTLILLGNTTGTVIACELTVHTAKKQWCYISSHSDAISHLSTGQLKDSLLVLSSAISSQILNGYILNVLNLTFKSAFSLELPSAPSKHSISSDCNFFGVATSMGQVTFYQFFQKGNKYQQCVQVSPPKSNETGFDFPSIVNSSAALATATQEVVNTPSSTSQPSGDKRRHSKQPQSLATSTQVGSTSSVQPTTTLAQDIETHITFAAVPSYYRGAPASIALVTWASFNLLCKYVVQQEGSIQDLHILPSPVISLELSPSNKMIATGLQKGTVIVWNTSTITERKCFQVAAAPITDLRFYEDKFLIALQKSAANGHIYNIKDGVLLSTFSALSLFISPFTPLICVRGKDERMSLLDMRCRVAGRLQTEDQPSWRLVSPHLYRCEGGKLVCIGIALKPETESAPLNTKQKKNKKGSDSQLHRHQLFVFNLQDIANNQIGAKLNEVVDGLCKDSKPDELNTPLTYYSLCHLHKVYVLHQVKEFTYYRQQNELILNALLKG